MRITKENNDKLKESLIERDITINATLEYAETLDLDDHQLYIIKKYTKLSQFQKDLLYLASFKSVSEIAELYCVSRSHIYNTLKKIKENLK